MKCSLAVLLILVPLTAVRADEKDDWTGAWILPRKEKIPMSDKDGKPLGAGFVSHRQGARDGEDTAPGSQQLRSGPHEGTCSRPMS